MGKTWVLDTETKGTGAEMVPLESVLEPTEARDERISVIRRAKRPRTRDQAQPRAPWRFRVVDVVSGEELAASADLRSTVKLLDTVRSTVDVRVYLWEADGEKWRLLTHREQQSLWGLRGR